MHIAKVTIKLSIFYCAFPKKNNYIYINIDDFKYKHHS